MIMMRPLNRWVMRVSVAEIVWVNGGNGGVDGEHNNIMGLCCFVGMTFSGY